jgi:hypothetical protein
MRENDCVGQVLLISVVITIEKDIRAMSRRVCRVMDKCSDNALMDPIDSGL